MKDLMNFIALMIVCWVPIWALVGIFFFLSSSEAEYRYDGLWWSYILAFLICMISIIVGIVYKIYKRKHLKENADVSSGIKKIKMVCKCGKEYPAGAVFCAVDGKRLTKKVVDNYVWTCPNCRKIFPGGIKYCPVCGRELVKSPKSK